MIVDQKYYEDEYKGEATVDDFDRLNSAAQSFIEYLTRQTAEQLICTPVLVLERVRKAICAQIEYVDSLGGIKAVNSKADVAKTSENYAGSYSYTIDSKNVSEVKYSNGMPVAPMAEIYLAPTGLLYAGVPYV